jgi:hypothetical protein
MKKLALLLGVTSVALGALAGGGSASPAVGAPVMTGLHNPRGLAIDNHGSLYVAEAGQGGTAPCAVFSDGMTKCYGPTGRVSRLRNGVQGVVADGLPSNAPAGGNGAAGPANIAVEGGHAFITDGLGANPLAAEIQPFRALGQGTLIKVHPGSHWNVVTDISAFEAANNPVGPPDSNPYGLINTGGHRVLTDAGGNDLLEVHGNHVQLLATFPSRPQRNTDAVPTTVAQGPDGSYYVGELSGAPVQRRRGERVPRLGRTGDGLVLRLHGDHLDRVRAGRSPVCAPVRQRSGADRARRPLPDRRGLHEDARCDRSIHTRRCRLR